MSEYSRKMPDLSQNPALAGKTVYSHGMNITYDKDGYAVKTVNPHHPNYAGTTKSICAQPIEDALAGKEWIEPSHEGLVDWNGGRPDYEHPLTSENEAQARERYHAAVAQRDRERRGED